MTAAPSLTGSVRVTLAIRTISENNAREHHMARARRRSAQRALVHLELPMHIASCRPVGPYLITLTRIAPRKLDSDNLQGAMKAIRDQVADELGINDGDEAHEWAYAQRAPRKREPGLLGITGCGVEVRVEARR